MSAQKVTEHQPRPRGRSQLVRTLGMYWLVFNEPPEIIE